MRLDKFLKVSRLIKRRTLAKEICDRQQVTLNGRIAKPGSVVKPGDIIEINFGYRQLKIQVYMLQENVPAKMAAEMYRIVEERKEENNYIRP